ncbi:MAG TPA: ParB/RepB/Spo0J family partition protein [Gemmatimonadales bacterium]|jgi:ParB family chromosome partitioning protein|nr:ParB/RepB/Spo0J family partition protein [Gemmatimonadales bacterium]
MTETRRLGRGLEALLGPISREQAERTGDLQELAVASIRPNPYQPRHEIDEPSLNELASSIQASGLLQPIVVRANNGSYQLIAGERRWRAVQRLGWQKIPAVVKDVDDRTLLTLALIENLQRDQLSAIEEAQSYSRLVEEFGVSQGEVARLVGRDRSTVANALRLLKLPENVLDMVHTGQLSEGHARALLSLGENKAIARMAERAVTGGWSVREMEVQVRGGAPARRPKAAPQSTSPASAAARKVEQALRERLGTDVRLTAKRRGRGLLSISYYSNDDLARLLEVILGAPFDG